MPLVQIQGQLEHLTYANEETNYTIARLRLPGRTDLVTVFGSFPSLSPGEVVKLVGGQITGMDLEQHKALAIAVKNDRVQKRYTRLAERLRNGP